MKPIISGIYMIRNRETGKVYIGSSNNISKRWRNHKSLLKNGKHHSIYLQNAYNKYGKNSFEYLVLKEVQEEDLLTEEKKFFTLYNSVSPKGYNISDAPGSPFSGRNHTDEAKRKQSEKNSGEDSPWYGKILTEEHNRNISKANKNFTDEQEKEFYFRYKNGPRGTLKKIADEYGVHQTTIRRAIDRYIRFRELYERSTFSTEDIERDIGRGEETIK